MVAPIAQHVVTVRESKSHESQKQMIYVAARASQVFFGLGCVISILGAQLYLAPLLKGGSFLYNTVFVLLRAAESIVCYDASIVSSNIASMFQSSCIQKFVAEKITDGHTRSVILKSITAAENYFGLPEKILKHLKKPKEIANAVTYNTIVASHLNPKIENFLANKIP